MGYGNDNAPGTNGNWARPSQIIEQQSAEIERLKATIKRDAMDYLKDNDTLRARVEKLEVNENILCDATLEWIKERDELRAQLAKEVEANHQAHKTIQKLVQATEALKPKPVVTIKQHWAYLDDGGTELIGSLDGERNLKLTFEDGKLVKAEVIG